MMAGRLANSEAQRIRDAQHPLAHRLPRRSLPCPHDMPGILQQADGLPRILPVPSSRSRSCYKKATGSGEGVMSRTTIDRLWNVWGDWMGSLA